MRQHDSFQFSTSRSGRGAKKLPGGMFESQIHILRVLRDARGPLSRAKIAERTGLNVGIVGWRVGGIDPEKRAKFEQSPNGGFRPSLITLGYVEEIIVDIDGLKERCVALTDTGRKATEDTDYVILPERSEDDESE